MANLVHKLDLSSLEKTTASLEEALNAYQRETNNQFIRDASIQRFEYTYELSCKMLKRYLEMTEPNAEEVDQMPFPNLVRTAAERGLLLNGWDEWQKYRHARNITSHTYNESKANEVIQILPQFLAEAKYALNLLQKRMLSS